MGRIEAADANRKKRLFPGSAVLAIYLVIVFFTTKFFFGRDRPEELGHFSSYTSGKSHSHIRAPADASPDFESGDLDEGEDIFDLKESEDLSFATLLFPQFGGVIVRFPGGKDAYVEEKDLPEDFWEVGKKEAYHKKSFPLIIFAGTSGDSRLMNKDPVIQDILDKLELH